QELLAGRAADVPEPDARLRGHVGEPGQRELVSGRRGGAEVGQPDGDGGRAGGEEGEPEEQPAAGRGCHVACGGVRDEERSSYPQDGRAATEGGPYPKRLGRGRPPWRPAPRSTVQR